MDFAIWSALKDLLFKTFHMANLSGIDEGPVIRPLLRAHVSGVYLLLGLNVQVTGVISLGQNRVIVETVHPTLLIAAGCRCRQEDARRVVVVQLVDLGVDLGARGGISLGNALVEQILELRG